MARIAGCTAACRLGRPQGSCEEAAGPAAYQPHIFLWAVPWDGIRGLSSRAGPGPGLVPEPGGSRPRRRLHAAPDSIYVRRSTPRWVPRALDFGSHFGQASRFISKLMAGGTFDIYFGVNLGSKTYEEFSYTEISSTSIVMGSPLIQGSRR